VAPLFITISMGIPALSRDSLNRNYLGAGTTMKATGLKAGVNGGIRVRGRFEAPRMWPEGRR
jgi:hypothetical protein